MLLHQRSLQRALKKYGVDSFTWELLEEVPKENLNEREKYYIEKYDSFYNDYNSTLGGEGCLGREVTQSTRDKIKTTLTGKYVGEDSVWYGKHHTDESKQKISEARKGKLLSEEHKQHIKDNAPRGGNHKKSKKVVCLETSEVFDTITQANKTYRCDVSKCIRSRCKDRTAGGYHWMYYDEYLEQEETV